VKKKKSVIRELSERHPMMSGWQAGNTSYELASGERGEEEAQSFPRQVPILYSSFSAKYFWDSFSSPSFHPHQFAAGTAQVPKRNSLLLALPNHCWILGVLQCMYLLSSFQ
jgi:hypothetical protein